MRYQLALTVAAVVAVTASAMTIPVLTSASAAAGTCHGRPATIVSAGGFVDGTEGDDVIAATGQPDLNLVYVRGHGGNDLICVTGTLSGVDDHNYPEVSGGPGDDSVFIDTGSDDDFVQVWDDIERLHISTGRGFDKVRLLQGLGAGGTGTISGGHGADLQIRDFSKNVYVDLADKLIVLDGTSKYKVSGFTRVYAQAPRVVIDGDRHRNALTASGCRVDVQGGRGDDVLYSVDPPSGCQARGARLSGQKGNDRLVGGPQDDVLLGGPGSDRATGMGGRDRCDAEKTTGCER